MIATVATCLCVLLPQDTAPRKKGFARGALELSQDASKAQRIPGGTEHGYQGALLDLPKGWRFVSNENGAELIAPPANRNAVTDEKFLLVHDPELTALDGAAIESSIQELVDVLQAGLGRIGAPRKLRFGDLDGRLHDYAGSAANGKPVAVRVHAFRAGNKISALVAAGSTEPLAARDGEIQAILGSMRMGNPAQRPLRKSPEEPEATTPAAAQRVPIFGGVAHQYEGVSFDIPKTWAFTPATGCTWLVPQGANPGGALEEGYVLTNDPMVLKLDAVSAEASVNEVVRGLQLPVQRSGPVRVGRFGDLDGRVFVYSGADPQGRKLEVRVYGFMGRGTACALTALGYSDVLARRERELQAILGSMTLARGPAPVRAPAPNPRGANHPELVGQWVLMTNSTTYNGGSASSNQISLQADGSYVWFSSSSSSNPNGGVAGESRESGTWSATDDTLTVNPSGGRSRIYRLEKRNHPKNKQDPMIVLDGRAFVTYGPKQPWR